MVEQFKVSVPAPSGIQDRMARIYLPKTYDGKKRFPVLYMFDGQTLFFDETAPFGDSWRMGETLDTLDAELIVAAVDCDEKDRLTEYSPFPFVHGKFSSEGKGENYLNWLIEVFKPTIDQRYKTLSERSHTFIAGSSMGGLMTVYALCRRSDIFAGGAALSPSFWVSPSECANMITSAELMGDITLYLDYGDKEIGAVDGERRIALDLCLGALRKKNLNLTFQMIKDGTHSEKTWRKQIPTFLLLLSLN